MNLYSVLIFILFSTFCTLEANSFFDFLGERGEDELQDETGKCDNEMEDFQKLVFSILEDRKKLMQQSFGDQNDKMEKMQTGYEEMRDDITNIYEAVSNIVDAVAVENIAFNAYMMAGGNYPTNRVVIFPYTGLNEGGGYSNVTGRFTAPAAGLYHLSVHICHAKAKYMCVAIVHGNENIAVTTAYESSSTTCGSVSVPVRMNFGEYVFVKSTYDKSVMYADKNYRRPSFSGHFVRK